MHEICQHFGSIDVLVNNAGHGYRAAIEESAPEAVEELFQTNFSAPWTSPVWSCPRCAPGGAG